MTDAGVGGDGRRISWRWSLLLLGAVYALPAVIVIPLAPLWGMALAVGVLPVAALRLSAHRQGRRVILLVGAVSAVCFVAGSVITQHPALAVVSMFVLAVGFAAWGRSSTVGRAALALCLPLVGIALSFDDLATSFVMAGVIVLGSIYAWGVAMMWPPRPVSARATAPVRSSARSSSTASLWVQ